LELATIDEALALVLAHAAPLESERVALGEACGRVLAAAARAAVDLPPFPSSAMDGFAVRAADAPGPLRVVDRSAAGRPATASVGQGESVAISTGAVVPGGADAVVPVEAVVHQDDKVRVPPDVEVGACIRPAGGDVEAGTEVVPRGAMLRPTHVGALAATGVAVVECTRRPRVRIVTTGTELRPPGEALGPGEIYESNGVMLEAVLRGVGAVVERPTSVGDDESAHADAIVRGLEADVLVTSGGVSMGAHDLVRGVAASLGVQELLWGVAVKPGKPLSFGVRGRTLVFGLPGNPVSSLVSALLFVRPALLALQGASSPGPDWQPGLLAEDVPLSAGREELLRARVDPGDEAVRLWPVAGQESHMIVRSAAAAALARIPRGDGVLPAGSPVRYLRLD
jgi:molybdopterin molybdotransferase